MVKTLVQRALRMAAGGAALSSAAAATDAPEAGYELVSAHIDGRDVIVFLDEHGMAVAVEIASDHVVVLTGLAAGARLSDVEAAERSDRPAFRLDRTSRANAAALIDGMARLSEAQKAELKAALDL